jgi:four helix bundle protein
MPRDYKQLKVFHAADDFVVEVYAVTRAFPKEETYGLTSQMRRAAVSVPANIVEGAAREGEREFLQFLNIAYSSLAEVGYYIHLTKRLGYLSEDVAAPLAARQDEISRMLNGLMRSFKHR